MLPDGLSEKTVQSLSISTELNNKFQSFERKDSERKDSIRDFLLKAEVLPEEDIANLFHGKKYSHYYFRYKKIAFEIADEDGIQRLVDCAGVPILKQKKKKDDENQEWFGKWPQVSGGQEFSEIHDWCDTKPRKNDEKKFSLDPSKIFFSEHALLRLQERYKVFCGAEIYKPEECARQLLKKAKEENAISAVGVVRRLIDNDFEEVRYFRHGHWRFVILEQKDETYLVKTIEYIYRK